MEENTMEKKIIDMMHILMARAVEDVKATGKITEGSHFMLEEAGGVRFRIVPHRVKPPRALLPTAVLDRTDDKFVADMKALGALAVLVLSESELGEEFPVEGCGEGATFWFLVVCARSIDGERSHLVQGFVRHENGQIDFFNKDFLNATPEGMAEKVPLE
jgi:hypothetical protein